MQVVFQILFWLCILLMLHSYVLFPLLLKILARNKKDNAIVFDRSDELPHVFILMSAYNEQKVIREKLDTVFDTDYPLNKLSFYIGSDNSTDETNTIIQEYAQK